MNGCFFQRWLLFGIPEKWDLGLETRDPCVGCGTQDTPPKTLHLGPGTQEPLVGPIDGTFTWDLIPGTRMWNSICETLFMEQIRGINVRQLILFIIVHCFLYCFIFNL